MANIEVVTFPKERENKEVSDRIQQIVEERNKVIAKKFSMEPQDITVELYQSTKNIAAKVDPNGEGMGVFGGYLDGSDAIMLIHPDAVQGLMDDVWKEMVILSDYVLIKYYLCKKYFPNREDFHLFYKYLSETLAQFGSGRIKESVPKFDIKIYVDGIRYKKEQQLNIIFYLMKKLSGMDFIYDNLDKFVEQKDGVKTFEEIYNKKFSEFVKPEKEKIITEERAIREAEMQKRRDKFRQQQQQRSQQQNNQNRRVYSKSNFKPQNRDNKPRNPHQRNHQAKKDDKSPQEDRSHLRKEKPFRKNNFSKKPSFKKDNKNN